MQVPVVPFSPFIGHQFALMNGNDRIDVARVVTEYLDEVGQPCRTTLGSTSQGRSPSFGATLQNLRLALTEEC